MNTNSDVYLGYAGWGAGGFSATDYNLTETPFTANGTFTDQKIVSQCIVGTRSGAGSNGTLGNTSTGTDGPLKSFVISGATATFDRSRSVLAVSVGVVCFGMVLIL